MGLFSRKTIISVASVIYPMGEVGDGIPDVVAANVITARMQDRSVAKAVRTSILDGVGVKLTQGFNYARSKYYAGLPKGLPSNYATRDNRTLELLIEEHLRRLYPSFTVDVISNSVSYEDGFRAVMQNEVAAAYDYDWAEAETLSATGSIQVGATLEADGPYYDWESGLHLDEVLYYLTFTNPDMSVVQIEEWYPQSIFVGHEARVARVTADYTLSGSVQQTFSYRFGGDDARLNLFLRQLTNEESGTFPAIVLKRDNVYLNNNRFSGGDWKSSAQYRTSKAYGDRMKIDIDIIIEKIRENASQGDIDYAFIQPGVILASTTQVAKKYLFNYFMHLFNTHPDNKPAYDAWIAAAKFPEHSAVKRNLAENCPAQSFRIYDPDNQAGTVNMEIAWRYITYEEKVGSLSEYQVQCGAQEIVVAKWHGKSAVFHEDYDVTKFFIRKPLTESTYAELCVVGLWHENYVYKGHSVQSGVWDMFNDPEGDYGTGFIIPLDYSIFLTLTPRERLQLAQEAFHLVFNCYVARKQKWYETGFFKFVLVIVSAIIIYFSWGTLTKFVAGLYAYLSATLVVVLGATLAAAIAAVLTAIIVAVVYVGISFVAKEAGEWAAEHWGPAWGAVVQIATAVVLTYGVGQISGMPTLPPGSLVDTVLRTSSFLLTGMSAYTDYTYSALKDEITTWEQYAYGTNNPLNQVNEMMEEAFPDMTIIQQAALPHPETMEEFLGRTLGLTDALTNRLIAPIRDMVELTLTPRLL